MKALPNFRRALEYVWPQKRLLAVMVLAVVGVSTFYTVSISSVLPLLQVMFYQDQTLPDWIYQTNAEGRLAVRVVPELATVNRKVVSRVERGVGVLIDQVRVGPLAEAGLQAQDSIIAINGRQGTQRELLRQVVTLPNDTPATFTIKRALRDDVDAAAAQPAAAADAVATLSTAAPRVETLTATPHKAHWYMPLAIYAIQWLPQGHEPADRFRTLVLVIVGLFVASLLGGLCKFCHEYTVGLIAERALIKMRTEVFSQVVQLPMSWFSKQQAGDTLSRVSRDTSVVEVGFKILFEKMLSEPLKAASVFALSLWIDWHLMLVVLITLPGAGWVIQVLGHKIKRAQHRSLQAWGQVLDLLEEKINGIKVLKAAHAERREGLQFFRRARRLYKQQVKISRADSATSPLLEVVGAVAVSGFILYGGYRVCFEGLQPTTFFTSAVCLGAMLAPIRRIANVNNRIQASESAASRVFEVLDLVRETDVPGAAELPRLKNAIELQDVTFTYPGAECPALCNVDLTIKAGQTLAIVGPNGSGKTTMSSLLLRFFEPTSGRILLDGVDIRKASLRSLRKQIGLVTQDTVIFTDTIRSNIAYADPKATLDQVQAAARAAHADDFIANVHSELGDREQTGYDAVVSARTLSGGQKQRIAIARAVLNDPAILIFDEATSQVDADSEKKIQEALAELTKGRTTLIIAHRLSTVINADRIAVMDEGRILAVGTHQHLLATSEHYRTFCEVQMRHG